MITKTLYMGEFYGELDITVRGDGDVYLTDMDDDECICIPRERLLSLIETIEAMVAEQEALPRHLK